MRIVGGEYKGRHIPVRKNFPSRPTTDFAKENLFNILANHFDFEQLHVLDLFAGTGSISYEFASRGASVDLVEMNYPSYRFIQDTLKKLGMEKVKAYKADVFKAVNKVTKKYDLVFADPPYNLKELPILPDLVFNKELLMPEGWFILEHPGNYNFNAHPCFFQLRNYGSVHFSIFRK